MQLDRSALRTYFSKLGLAHEIADLYLALYVEGPQTIMSLSRTAQVERTRIYRLIDMLLDSNLVEVETHNKRTIIKAAPISQLRILIDKRAQELKNLTDELELLEQVLARTSLSNEAFHTRLYNSPTAILHLLEELATIPLESSGSPDVFIHGIDRLADQVGEKSIDAWLSRLHVSNIPVHRDKKSDSATWVARGDTVVYIQSTTEGISALALRNNQIADSHRQLFALMTKS